MGMQRSLFLLGLSLTVALGAAWGLAMVEINSISWRLGLSIPAGLVVFWPIAQHLANSPLCSMGARPQSTIEFTLKFLARAIAAISSVAAVVAWVAAPILAIAGRSDTAKIAALFGVRALAVALGFLLLALAFYYIFKFLVKKFGAVQLDIFYLAWAGAAVLAFGGIVASHRWIGVLDPSGVSERTTISAWIAAVGVGYAWVQILGATPREKKVVIPDALMTAGVVVCVAVMFWLLGTACLPVGIGMLAWVGALVLDKEQKKRKF